MSVPLKVKFWGVRGSIPSPGKETVRYGGNTACVEIRYGDSLFICDSGTGIRKLGMSLMKEFKDKTIDANIFIGHSHWDHIQGFPFFVPAYLPKNRFKVHSAKSVGDSFENILRGQMGQNYFPVEVADMHSQLEFVHVDSEFEVGGARVKTTFTNHPGVNIAYRFEFPDGRSVVYLSDHENHQSFSGVSRLTVREDRMIEQFCRDADVLIVDSQYTDEEYKMKRGWGHSRWKDSLKLGMSAGAKRVALYHHDPTRPDEGLDKISEESAQIATADGSKIECFAAQEEQEIIVH